MKGLRVGSLGVLGLFLSLLAGCGGGVPGTTSPAPAPLTVTSVSPAKITAGATATTITVNGTGFTKNSVVQVGGTAEATTYVSSTQLTAIIPAGQLASGSMLTVVVVDGSQTSSTGTPITFEVDNPLPAITSLAPSSFTLGSAASNVTVTGTGFVPSTTIQVGGSNRTTTYVSATQVTAALTAADFSTAGTLSLTAVNPTPGGGTSSAATIAVNNPAPTLTSINPTSIAVGTTTSQTVTLTGSGFLSGSVIKLNGNARTTTYVSATQLTTVLTSADFATAGNLSFTVTNPTPGGGTSSAVALQVANPYPGITSLNPSSAYVGSTAITVTVNGSGFVSSSVVQVGGSARSTTYVSATQLTFQLTAADQSAQKTLSITVMNPTPGGETSAAASFAVTIAPGQPSISGVSPTQFIGETLDISMTVNGTNFNSSSVVQWNGNALATKNYAGTLTATVPEGYLASPGTASVTVSNTGASVPLSNAVQVTIGDGHISSFAVDSSLAAYSIDVPFNTNAGLLFNSINGDQLAGFTFSVNGVAAGSWSNPASYNATATVPASAIPVPGQYKVVMTAANGPAQMSADFNAFVSIANNDMVWDPVTGLFYLSVPSSAGAPYGNSVVSLDPATGALGTPISVGSEPNKLALTADGKYLWVGLDGVPAVRKVDLTTGTAGLQFSLPPATKYAGEKAPTAVALYALPGATNSVIVSTGHVTISNFSMYGVDGYDAALAIYDSGVARPDQIKYSQGTLGYISQAVSYGMQVDGTKAEIYTPSENNSTGYPTYNVYSYDANGITLKLSTSVSLHDQPDLDDVQLVNGRLYTPDGKVTDPETGAQIAKLNVLGNVPFYVSSTDNKIFVLAGTAGNVHLPTYTYVNVYSLADYSLQTYTVPFDIGGIGETDYHFVKKLTRWGDNGLAVRSERGVYVVRSDLFKATQ